MRLHVRAFIALSMLGAVLAAVPAATLSSANAATTPISATVIGTTADTAAGSCWEIKQARPTAASGAYWLLTPKMLEPQQFYCDMTTDGGGWVLVGKGRENWTMDYAGQGSASNLLTAGPGATLSETTQLPSRSIDALLNGGRVDALTDGIRLKRARNTAGTTWQEVRMPFSAKKDRWSWTMGAEIPMTKYTFDGVTRTQNTTSASFGSDNAYNRVINNTDQAHTYKLGFMYGASVLGSSSATSYLWTPTNNGASAIPYTEVYLRPKVMSTDAGFTSIADGGTAAVAQQKTLKSNALVTNWGVANRTGSTADEWDVEVQAFTQSGNVMYVGGNFSTVQKDAAGTGAVTQPYLAAFDVNTGELISTFKPQLNEQVHALATLPDGSVVAAGEFTQANGKAVTGIVDLDPTTGATMPNWNVTLQNNVTGAVLRIRSLDVRGSWLYIGGNLTHAAGGSKPTTFQYMRNLARVSVTDGTPGTGWNPNFNGGVIKSSGSADGTREYAVGFFTTANGVAAPNAAAVLTSGTGTLATPAWNPTWSAAATYQQAVGEVAGRLWVGGSEHSLFSYNPSTFARLSGNIAKSHGDTQAFASGNGLVFAGCHCDQYEYENAFRWPTLNTDWSRVDAIDWFAQWDAATGARVPDFTPNFNMRNGNGIWALATDSLGNVWAGGDISTVKTTAGMKFSGGFARFTWADSTPPATPTNVKMTSQDATTATFTWDKVVDSNSAVRYEILRDDRPIGFTSANTPTITVPKGGSNRFFVRTVDASNNVSASSPVVAVGTNQAPTASFTVTQSSLQTSFDATASKDSDGTISSYAWNFGDGATDSGAKVTHTYAAAGTYTVTLTVTDNNNAPGTAQQTVNAAVTATDHTVIAKGDSWRWRFQAGDPPAGWNTAGFDATAWSAGAAVLGFGTTVATNIDTFADPSTRPIAAYFTKTFQVDDPTKITKMTISSVANDGAVFYVNGSEVGRVNMPAGAVTSGTYATAARSAATANASPVTLTVPTSVLTAGTNVVAVETHSNYRKTPDLTFDLSATLTY